MTAESVLGELLSLAGCGPFVVNCKHVAWHHNNPWQSSRRPKNDLDVSQRNKLQGDYLEFEELRALAVEEITMEGEVCNGKYVPDIGNGRPPAKVGSIVNK